MSQIRKLTGPEIRALRDALISSFSGPDDLTDLVLYGLNQRLDVIIKPGNLNSRVRDLIQWTEARDRTDELIAAALDATPQQREVRAIAEQLRADEGVGKFERIVRQRLGLPESTDFLDGLIRSMNAVCRVEFNGEGVGTGFLVGPSLVITNHHVVFDDNDVQATAAQLAFHFDYKLLEGRKTRGITYNSSSNGMIVADSARTALDYTLVRLDTDAGNARVGELDTAPVRGWLKPKAQSLVNNDPLIIIQHPKASTQKLALGTVTTADGPTPANRVRYNVNTDEGSSGAPCFNSDFAPVALHHWGDTDHNRGVLFSAILADLESKGVSLGS